MRSYEILVGLMMVSYAAAADGPALAQIRTRLPTAGTVLADHEDPATLLQGLAEGSKAQVVSLVDREEGGRENIEAEGYWLKAIFTKSELVS